MHHLRTSAHPGSPAAHRRLRPDRATIDSRSRGGALRRGAVALVAVVVTSVVAVAAPATGPVAAAEGELAINALAAEITGTAERAVRAHDRFVRFGGAADHRLYEQLRDDTARLAARQIGYDQSAMVEAWDSAGAAHQLAVLAAMTQVGVPYRSNASIEGEAFDCSGLTLYAWQRAGVALDRVSGDQIRSAARVDREGAQPGDLVHYPGHVMMYLGVGDAVVHTFSTGRTVEIDTISERRSRSVSFGDPTG